MKINGLILFICFLFLNTEVINSWSYNPLCWIGECCNSDYIESDAKTLNRELKNRVYGQHLTEVLVRAIADHWGSVHNNKRPLTISFNGSPGSGKSYVSNVMAESLYKFGRKSKFVHYFEGRLDFPREDHVIQYQENLYGWLKGNISECPKQLFIFDQVDKIPPKVLDAIKPIIDYDNDVDGVDYTQSIFIFISNTGATSINAKYLKYSKAGKRREELKLRDFENLVKQGTFNQKADFHHSDVIESDLIDYYIPFLPMEKEQIKKCIQEEFGKYKVHAPKETQIKEVLDFIKWSPEDLKIFSRSGCKRISSKVAVVVGKNGQLSKKNEL